MASNPPILTAGISYTASPATQTTQPARWQIGGYYFDCWLRLHHNTSLTMTKHPVQLGTEVTDHSYLNARQFSFDVGISDCMQSIWGGGINVKNPPQFTAQPTRSINAYNLLTQLQATRQFVNIISKYTTSNYCLITSIDVHDEGRTMNAMIATINLEEAIVVGLQTSQTSAFPMTTSQTQRGQVVAQPTLVQDAINNLNAIFAPNQTPASVQAFINGLGGASGNGD